MVYPGQPADMMAGTMLSGTAGMVMPQNHQQAQQNLIEAAQGIVQRHQPAYQQAHQMEAAQGIVQQQPQQP